jgi:hypothetical protein
LALSSTLPLSHPNQKTQQKKHKNKTIKTIPSDSRLQKRPIRHRITRVIHLRQRPRNGPAILKWIRIRDLKGRRRAVAVILPGVVLRAHGNAVVEGIRLRGYNVMVTYVLRFAVLEEVVAGGGGGVDCVV